MRRDDMTMEPFELDPALLAALADLQGEGRSATRRGAGRAAVLVAAARGRERAGGSAARWRRRFAVAALTFTGANLALGGVVALAAGAQPDSFLYGIKRATEAAKLSLTFDPVDKARLELQLADRRAAEAAAMAHSGHTGLALDAARDATSLVREAQQTLDSHPSVDNAQALAHASAEARDRLQEVFAALENSSDPGASEAARSLDSAWSNGLGRGEDAGANPGSGSQGSGPEGNGAPGASGNGGVGTGGQSTTTHSSTSTHGRSGHH